VLDVTIKKRIALQESALSMDMDQSPTSIKRR